MVIGFNWKRATPLAANTAIITSLGIYFLVKLFKITIPFGIDIGAISFITSLTLFISISLLSASSKLDKDVETIMDI